MHVFEIIIKSLIICGGIIVLYLILRDPRKAIISFFRSTFTRDNIPLSIIFSPISFPVWILDKIFNLGIFYEDMEEVSRPVIINPAEFDQYVLVNLSSEKIMMSFLDKINEALEEFNPKSVLDIDNIQYTKFQDKILFKINNKTNLEDFITLTRCWNYTDYDNVSINAKGILLNQKNIKESLFLFDKGDYIGKVIGKDYQNNKLYFDVNPKKSKGNTIFYNYTLDYFRNFKFKKFNNDLTGLQWKKITCS